MPEDPLASELRQVTAELTAAIEGAGSEREIESLRARQALLSKAMAHAPRRRPAGLAAGYLTDAIVAVINAAGTEMSADQVLAALRRGGRADDTQQQVLTEMAYLAGRGRITRVSPGLYAPASGAGD